MSAVRWPHQFLAKLRAVRHAQASLLTAGAGLDAVFFARADYQGVALRRESRNSELIWSPSSALPGGADGDGVFCGTFPNHYGPPRGFNFGWGQDDPPVQVWSAAVNNNR